MMRETTRHAIWRRAIVLLAVVVTIAAWPRMTAAATVTWDADGTTTTGSATDGGGAWLGASQWWNGSNVTWASGDDAVFGAGGTGGAVTLSAPTGASSLMFNTFSGTYALGTSGQALTLGSGGLTMNADAGNVTLVSPVTLGAAQSWTNNSSSLLAAALVANGGNLLTVAGSGNSLLDVVSGAGGLAKSGSGTLTLSGATSYTGGTIVSGGTLTLATGAVSGFWDGVIGGSLTVSNGATVNATRTWSLGAGGPNSPQPATRSVTDITLTGGTLNITSGGVQGGMSPTTITMTGGALTGQGIQWYYGNSSTVSLITNASSATSTVSAPILLRLNKTPGAGSLTLNVAPGTTSNGVDLLVSGAISDADEEGAGGRIVKTGAGTLRMTAINSYAGGTTVEAGTLSLGNGGLNGVVRGSLAIQPGAKVVASANGWSLGYGGTRAGAAYSGNSVTSITIDGGLLEITNPVSGAGLAANTITLTGGTIGGGSFGWINTNTLTPTLRTLASSARSTLSGGISLRLSSSGTLTFDVAAGSTSDGIDLMVSGPITNSTEADNSDGSVLKTGAGTLTLSAQNTFNGGVTVTGGTLASQAQNGLAGSLQPNQNYTITNATLTTIGTNYNALGGGGVGGWTSGTATINAGGLLYAGNEGSNAHNIYSVVLAGGTLGAGTGTLNAALANWYINGGITATGSTTSTISASLGKTAGGVALPVAVDDGSTLTISGRIVNIGGSNGLTKTGAGTLTLSGLNTFTGATSITGGRLEVASGGQINGTSGITINGAGAELKYNSATPLTQPITFTQGTLSGTGTIGTAVTAGAGDILSPGNSPGTQSYTAGLTWSGSGSYLWELNSLSGTAGVNWDVINVSGSTFDLSGLSAENRFILDLTTLTGANAAGPLDVSYDGGSYTFPIASYAALSSPLGTAALTDLTSLFDIRLTNWALPRPQASDISVRINASQSGLDLVIVPEPTGLAVATIGIAAAALSLRTRRRRSVS
jgi:autotransporter-associated beta strand protein